MNRSGFVIVYEGQYTGLKDKSGKVILPCEFDKILDYDDDGYVRFIRNDVYGTIDLDGNVCIPLSAGITHLGVFHKGTARARINDMWGLVDTGGKPVTEFTYKSVEAHRRYGYTAVTSDGRRGILSEKGVFKENAGKKGDKSLYQYIAAYRNNVAPAYTYDGKWVFIDENNNRINDIEYWSMEHVLRNGVYIVAKSSNAYGFADYRGVPLIDEWFDNPCKFDKGFAVCGKKRLDENGNEIITEGGQPAYYYGVLDLQGKYLFPLVYSELHWNDYEKKDCWFAEDDNWAYLLFPDGSRRVYRKSVISYDKDLEHIPESAYDDNVKYDDDIVDYHPILITTRHTRVFHENLFIYMLSRWVYNSGEGQKFFYRDTDADIDVNKLYKAGAFVRTDRVLKVSTRLMRPVHKIRFLIVAGSLVPIYNFSREHRDDDNPESQEYSIPENADFAVIDVQKHGATTQVVLLYIPHNAMLIAREFKVNLTKLRISQDGDSIKKAAEYDMLEKMGECVHGHSLNEEWCRVMYQPVGCNEAMQLNRLIMKPYSDLCSEIHMRNNPVNWDRSFFENESPYTINVMQGDINRCVADVMVNPVGCLSCPEGSHESMFFSKADKELYGLCDSELGKAPGSVLVTDAFNMPYDKIIHVRVPDEKCNTKDRLKVIKSSLAKVLMCAGKNQAKYLLLPAMAFAGTDEIETVVRVMVHHIFNNLSHCNISIIARNASDAAAYKSFLDAHCTDNFLNTDLAG